MAAAWAETALAEAAQWAEMGTQRVKQIADTLPYFELAIVFLVAAYVFEVLDAAGPAYLDYRQRRRTEATTVPAKLEGIVSPDKFLKAQAYSRDKLTFSMATSLFNVVRDIVFLVCGVLPFLWLLAGQLLETVAGIPPDSNEMAQSVVFFLFYLFVGMVMDTPFNLFAAFVVEERHGFNKQTLTLFWTDWLKGLAVSGVLIGPIVALVVWTFNWGGPRFYIYVWGALFVVQLVLLTIYPTLIQPLFNKVTPLEPSALRTAIEDLARKVQFPLKQLYVIDGSKRSGHSNAYFYGFFRNKRIVLFDTLLQQMDQGEVVAVLGHELGHWKQGHTIKNLVISQLHLLAMLFLFGHVMDNASLYESFGFFDSKPKMIGLTLFTMTIFNPVEHVLAFAMHALSRRFEFEADRFAKRLGYAAQLRSGLIKLQLENLGNMNPDPWYSTYHYSHPPLVERLGALDKAD